VVSPSAVSNSWTTRPVPLSATSRAQVRLLPNRHPGAQGANHMQSARTTFSAYSSPSVRPGVCDKRTPTRAAAFYSVSEFFAKAMGIYTDFTRMKR